MLHGKYKKLCSCLIHFERQVNVFQVVERKYQEECDRSFPITFGTCADRVALDIPNDGTNTDNGWEIVPIHKAHVSPWRFGRCNLSLFLIFKPLFRSRKTKWIIFHLKRVEYLDVYFY